MKTRPSIAGLAGLVFGGIATFLLWQHTERLTRSGLLETFGQRVDHAILAVDRTLDEVTGSMQTIRSLVETSGELDQGTFERVVGLRNQRLFHTGLQYIGLAPAVRAGAQACPPETRRGLCLPMRRLFPLATNENLLEADLIGEARRTEAITRAIDSGYIAVTAPLPFAPDNIASPGLLAYLPIYRRSASLASVESRREALEAVAVVSFSLEDIVRAELGPDFLRHIGFVIVDRGLVGAMTADAAPAGGLVLDGPRLLRTTAGARAPERETIATREVQRGFAGREWLYRFEMPAPPPADPVTAAPRLTLVLGGMSTLLLAVFLQYVSRARSRAEALAGEMSQHFKQSESQLRLALDAAQMGAWTWDGERESFAGDAVTARLLPMGGRQFVDLFTGFEEPDRDRAVQAVRQALEGDGIVSIEARLADPGPRARHVELVAHLGQDDRGRLVQAVGLVRDISERIDQAASRRQLLHRLVTAEEQERRRIARELHDQLGQEITAISFGLKHLEGLDGEPQARADLLVRLREIVQTIDARVDQFMLDLRPVVLDDLGLDAALQAQFEQWSEVHGIQVNSHIVGLRERRLPFEVATTAFRLVQESLTNVARHAGASTVDVIVELVGGDLRVVIEDNGRGVVVPVITRRQGLDGMRERVESLGGEFRYESSAGSGFTVFARLPCTACAGAEA